MPDRLDVLVVQAYAGHGGSEGWLAKLLAATDRLDARVLLLQDGPFRGQLEDQGLPVEVLEVGTSPLDLPGPALRLARRLRRDHPDVVLANVLKAGLVAAPAGRLAGVPVVWAKHDFTHDRYAAIALGHVVDEVVGAVEELAAPTRRRDAVIVPPPRPDEPPATREQAVAFLRERGVPVGDEVPTLVMAGRVMPLKGIDDAVRALAHPAGAAWRLVVVGDDDPAAPGASDELRALAAGLGVADRVHFSGLVPRVSHWLAAFDALAVLTKPTGDPRSPDKEGFGTSAFEAMVAGVPVIGVRGGAVVRRLEHRAGAGVPPGDPEAVATALAWLADPVARAAAGAAGREIVARHPDAAACAALLVTALDRAIARRRG